MLYIIQIVTTTSILTSIHLIIHVLIILISSSVETSSSPIRSTIISSKAVFTL
jgi:hypothetical protein